MKISLSIYTILGLILFLGCKKTTKSNDDNKGLAKKFHKDIIIHEDVRGSEQPQNSLGLYQLANSSNFVFTGSRGMNENDARGFRIGGIIDDEIKWIKSYSLPETYTYQFSTCSALDKNQNIWMGGHIFGVPDSYGRPFLAKLTSDGKMLWSKYLNAPAGPNLLTARAVSIKALTNGDLAFLLLTVEGYIFHRINTEGNVLWSKTIKASSQLGFDDPFRLPNNVSSINKTIAESSEGDIYIAFTSNYPVRGKDCLVKMSSNGEVRFAKSYQQEEQYNTFPAQIVTTHSNQIVYAGQRHVGSSSLPHLYILSTDGGVIKARRLSANTGFINPFAINELNYFNNQIHLTTTLGYEFANYILDPSLTLLKSEKVLGTSIISTERGGVSFFDNTSNSLYHLLDVSGALGDGNGFQFIKTDNAGKSCHGYSNPPQELLLENSMPTVLNESSIVISNTTSPPLQTLNWQLSSVGLHGKETVCSE